jgi:hypothetical protein
MEDSQQHLLRLGFEVVGYWMLSQGQIQFVIQQHRQDRDLLYAFTSEECVLYIGKTTQTLYQRMNGYRDPGPSQKTNIRNHELILELLQKGLEVEILALVPKEVMSYRGIQVNIAAGIEDNLITFIKPPWNIFVRTV